MPVSKCAHSPRGTFIYGRVPLLKIACNFHRWKWKGRCMGVATTSWHWLGPRVCGRRENKNINKCHCQTLSIEGQQSSITCKKCEFSEVLGLTNTSSLCRPMLACTHQTQTHQNPCPQENLPDITMCYLDHCLFMLGLISGGEQALPAHHTD